MTGIRKVLPGLALLCLLVLGAAQLWRLAQECSTWSLRYNSPVPGAAASAARAAAVENPDESLWPTFWREMRLPLETELAVRESQCIVYSGEGALVWPGRFVTGSWPGATDEGGCVVSDALAWRLWGSTDVLGKSLAVDGRTCMVRGVLHGDKELCMVQTGDNSGVGSMGKQNNPGWQAVEFRAVPGLGRNQIDAFLRAGGLAPPDAILPGGGVVTLAAWLFVLPAVPALLWLFARLVGRYAKKARLAARLAGGLLLLGLALVLPVLLGLLPAWVLPSRWSDFSHWAALLGQLGDFMDTLLLLPPALRDGSMKRALLWLLASSCAACPLWLWAGRVVGEVHESATGRGKHQGHLKGPRGAGRPEVRPLLWLSNLK